MTDQNVEQLLRQVNQKNKQLLRDNFVDNEENSSSEGRTNNNSVRAKK